MNPSSIQEITLVFKDDSKHTYLFNNDNNEGKVFFIVKEKKKDSNNEIVEEETKYITLCEEITNCTFYYDSEDEKILKTTISINDLTYNNNFKIISIN